MAQRAPFSVFSPRTTFLLTLVGVLLVGLTLHHLTTATPPPAATPADNREAPVENVYATLQFTGQPESLVLRHGDRDWTADTSLHPAELEVKLPRVPRVEIEVLASWPERGQQVVTLILEPDGRESRTATRWSEKDSDHLHHVFTFQW